MKQAKPPLIDTLQEPSTEYTDHCMTPICERHCPDIKEFIIKPVKDAANLSEAVADCIVKFGYPRAVLMPEAEKDNLYCFCYGSSVYMAKGQETTMMVCTKFRELFARPEKLSMQCLKPGCNRTFETKLAHAQHMDANSALQTCNINLCSRDCSQQDRRHSVVDITTHTVCVLYQ
jgi:hypothetical protein